MTLNVQFLTMIFMILGGFYLGIALDTFRRFSPLWKKNNFLLYFMEVLFWLTQTFVLFYILFRINAGELRVYVFIACLLGFSIYQVIATTLYKRILEWIISIILSIYHFFKRIIEILIIAPIIWIGRVLFIIVLFIANFLVLSLFSIAKIIFLPLKWTFQLIYFMLPKSLQKIIYKIAVFYSIIQNKVLKYIKRR